MNCTRLSRVRVGAFEAWGGRGGRGFALPVVVFGLAALAIASVAGLVVVGTESRLAANERDGSRAFFIAQAALERFVAENTGSLPAGPVTYSMPGGQATVSFRKALDLDFPNQLYLLTSAATADDPMLPGLAARRTIREFAVYRRAAMNVTGSIVSPGGIEKEGASGVIAGNDAATTSVCPEGGQPAKAGVVVPPAGYQQDGGPPVPSGNPPISEEASADAVAALLDIPWAELSGGGFPVDYEIPQQAWPNFSSLPADFYPSIRVTQNKIKLGPVQSGRGTLIVTGDLELEGTFRWDGIILVGDSLESNGNNTVRGTVAASLNVLLGGDPAEVELKGTKTFEFHSCNVLNAGKRLAYLRLLENTWWEVF
ncbi:MAG: hypothetical protein HY702_00490 [Gemmatimonadetes bacterium]|nr:hypothetical protein [Gemmatimonadota bacterium]